ncbi:MAG: HEAT repeat domain-containing protein [Candidatus Ozemobacteraceae bacterium]
MARRPFFFCGLILIAFTWCFSGGYGERVGAVFAETPVASEASDPGDSPAKTRKGVGAAIKNGLKRRFSAAVTRLPAMPSLDTVKGLLSKNTAKAAYDRLAAMGTNAIPDVRAMLSADNLRLVRAALDLAEKIRSSSGSFDGAWAGDLGKDLMRILVNPRFGGLRVRATRLLGRFGPVVNGALPVLMNALSDPDRGLREASAEAALDVFLRGRQSLSNFGRSLSDPKNPARKLIITGLEQYGATLNPALPLVAAWAKKGHIDAGDVLALAIPKFLPGAGKLAGGAADLFAQLPELADMVAQDESDGIDPDAPAVEEDAAAADLAERAASFEDIPAGE